MSELVVKGCVRVVLDGVNAYIFDNGAILLPLAIVLPILLANSLLGGNEYSQAALFALLILPPPFIIPLCMKPGMPEERRYVNNVPSLSTLVSIVVFVVCVGANPLEAPRAATPLFLRNYGKPASTIYARTGVWRVSTACGDGKDSRPCVREQRRCRVVDGRGSCDPLADGA